MEASMQDFEPPLIAAITLASDFGLQLLAALNHAAGNLTSTPTAEFPAAIANLSAARDLAMSQLHELSGKYKPNTGEWQALIALQQLDSKITLAKLNYLVAAEPQNTATRYHRAIFLAGLGNNELAKQDFLNVLTQEPRHFGALIDFGNLLLATGYLSAARTLYQQAITAQPGATLAHVNLANLLQSQGEYIPAKHHYLAALALEPGLPEAHQGLSYVLNGLGEETAAIIHRELGFREHAWLTWPYKGPEAPVRILILSSASGGNIPLKHILNDQTFACTLVFCEYFSAENPLPPHSLIFNAIGDADLCPLALTAALALTANCPAAVLNPPKLVQLTGRALNASRLRNIPGVITPKSVLFSRLTLLQPGSADFLRHQGLNFPLLLRSPGFHTGQYFLRIETAEDLPQAVNDLPGEALLAIELLDTLNTAGEFHKYRVMFVAGKLYPLHLAVSKHWKVHYFSANMQEQPEARQQEQAFLNDMPGVLGAKAFSALENICGTLALDYAGVDFALSADGDILLFEANATMVIPCPDKDEQWFYRKPAIEQVLAAVRNMVLSHAQPGEKALGPTFNP